MRVMIACLIIFLVQSARAEGYLRPQAGLGVTDNANYSDIDRKSDVFWWLGGYGQYTSRSTTWGLSLNFKDYGRENQNDLFSYRLSGSQDVKLIELGNLAWQLALGGQQYPGGSPAQTEDTYNNIYLESTLAKDFSKEDWDFTIEPGLRVQAYTELDNRLDKILFLIEDADWQYAQEMSLRPYAEQGFDFSSQRLYSNYYFEIGTDWVWDQKPWQYKAGASVKETFYYDRVISAATPVSNRRGRIVGLSQTETEAQTRLQIQGSVERNLTSEQQLKGAIFFSRQSTRSGYSQYREAELQIAYICKF